MTLRFSNLALLAIVIGAALQLVSIGLGFYEYNDRVRWPWQAVPHTAHLLLASALVGLAITLALKWDRLPMSARAAGLVVAGLGALATLQVVYRMLAPPFDAVVPSQTFALFSSCMYFCWPSQAHAAAVLPGMWIALLGSALVFAGGLVVVLGVGMSVGSGNVFVAEQQPGPDPWLALMALAAIGQFVFGFTVFAFFKAIRDSGVTFWSGWLSIPHTGAVVLLVTVLAVGFVWLAFRSSLPVCPQTAGWLIAAGGLISTAMIVFRILKPPFSRGPIEIGPAAYASAVCGAVMVIIAASYAMRMRGQR